MIFRFIGRYKDNATPDIVNRLVHSMVYPLLQSHITFNSVEELSKKKGVSMAQIAVAWCLSKPHVTAPIVGTTSLSNLEDILGENLSCLSQDV